MQISYIISLLQQPIILASSIGVVAFLVGALRPWSLVVNGSVFFENVILFIPRMFLGVLDAVHTKRFRYYGLVLALLAIEAFFGFRASTVYYDVLSGRVDPVELVIISVIVFIAIFLGGYMVATHSTNGFSWSMFGTGTLVILHDWAGTIYMNYSGEKNTQIDPLKLIITIGMCLFCFLPFIMGRWAEELRPEMMTELETETNEFVDAATRKIKRRAVNMVLRKVSHTDVVKLVQALPSDEFQSFKDFVIPIIDNKEAKSVEMPVQALTPVDEASSEVIPEATVPLLPESTSASEDDQEEDDTEDTLLVDDEQSDEQPQGAFANMPEMTTDPNLVALNEQMMSTKNPPVRRQKSSSTGDTEAIKKVRRLVNKNSQITTVELAQKAQISRSYAGKLKTQVLAETEAEEQTTLQKTIEVLRNNPQITDEDLASILGLKRAGSAQLWRIKAQSLLTA